LKDHIQNVKLPESDESDSFTPEIDTLAPFNSNYDGRLGYSVFSIQHDNQQVKYVKIVEFVANNNNSELDSLSPVVLNFTFYKGVDVLDKLDGMHCEVNVCMSNCMHATYPTSSTAPPDDKPKNLLSVAFGVPLFVFVIISVLLLALLLWQRLKNHGM